MRLDVDYSNKLKSKGSSDYHKILKDEGWGGAGLTDEQADKCEFLERKAKVSGIDKTTHFRQHQIDRVK